MIKDNMCLIIGMVPVCIILIILGLESYWYHRERMAKIKAKGAKDDQQ